MNKLLEGGGNATSYIVLGLLAALLLLLFFFSSRNKKKEMEYKANLEASLKKGINIVTSFGVYGKILEIKETTDGKIVTISTGEKGKETLMDVHINAIMSVDNKKMIVYDENGNDITNYDDVKKENENISSNKSNEILEKETVKSEKSSNEEIDVTSENNDLKSNENDKDLEAEKVEINEKKSNIKSNKKSNVKSKSKNTK